MILVTGASGLLGANILSRARDQGLEVAGLCHRHILNVPGIEMLSVDLTDDLATRQLFMLLRPAGIIHCAAATNVDWCEDHPETAERLNGQVSGALAAISFELNCRFVYVSTDAVFDGKRGNYSEEDDPSPVNAYARSKLCGERLVSLRNPHAAIARVTIYGWNAQDKLSLAEWALKRLEEGEKVPGFVDVHFTPISASDLADYLLKMLNLGLAGVYHVGGSERISKYDFARLIAQVFGFDPERVTPTRLVDAALRAPRPADTSLSTAKIRGAMGCEMRDAISGVRSFREQRENGYALKLKNYLTGAVQ